LADLDAVCRIKGTNRVVGVAGRHAGLDADELSSENSKVGLRLVGLILFVLTLLLRLRFLCIRDGNRRSPQQRPIQQNGPGVLYQAGAIALIPINDHVQHNQRVAESGCRKWLPAGLPSVGVVTDHISVGVATVANGVIALTAIRDVAGVRITWVHDMALLIE
jgi:hypothetical protein